MLLGNTGNSYGLEYPWVFAKVGPVWVIWHRDEGKVAWVSDRKLNDAVAKAEAEKICRDLCVIKEPTPAERAAINAAHDEEP